MQFNITFFLQIFNFTITYWFLNKFMFRPVISFIKNRNAKDLKIKNDIENKEQNLLNLEKEKLKDLQDFKMDMNEKYQVNEPNKVNIPSKILGEVDKSEVEHITKIVKKILVERVPHVD